MAKAIAATYRGRVRGGFVDRGTASKGIPAAQAGA
jgi:hypothetical protein